MKGRIVLVTGASRGIGRAAALALAAAGATVIGTARSRESFEGLALPDGWVSATPMEDADAIAKLCAEIGRRHGRLDGFFGNAGVLGPKQPIGVLNPDDYEAAMAINVTANLRLLTGLDGLLRASAAGRVLFVTSGVAWKRYAAWTPYAVSKAALEALAGVYAHEVADTAVRVNCISPGPIRTELRTEAWPDENPDGVPSPEALGPHILHLLSPACEANGMIFDFKTGKFVRGLPPA